MYKPSFICPHCNNVIQAKMANGTTMGGLAFGHVPACSCPESQKAWEAEHRARIESRKRAKRSR